MTTPATVTFEPASADGLAAFPGRIAALAEPGRLDAAARPLNRAMKGALERAAGSAAFGKLKPGEALELAWPGGLAAEAVHLVRLGKKSPKAEARKAGTAVGRAMGEHGALVLAGGYPLAAELAFGIVARAYDFADHKTGEKTPQGAVTLRVADAAAAEAAFAPLRALAEGIFFTRDLVSEPANVLTTTAFADRLAALGDLGLAVEVIDEDRLAELGMGALLGVGQGSESPSKVVVMEWRGGGDAAPLAIVGKGVVFDTGGISIKPAGGMEDMTMDMGGAGTVAGVMRALALRKAPANVVGLVGLVENMPDGKAQRPGDVVRSMKGDTIEVINTDAEGRLVLADVIWYAQERFKPAGVVDLATLTGAIIVALGHENAGVFSNDDGFAGAFLAAAAAEGEGAWRMPLGDAYAKMLKSQVADIKNIGGRDGGSVTAAEFIHRFVKDGTPWIHLDIAGVAHVKADTALAPKGATGWGVLALDRLVRDRYEQG